MDDQISEAIELAYRTPGNFRDQLDRMRQFRDKMQIAGAATRPEQFSVRNVEQIEPRRSIAIHS